MIYKINKYRDDEGKVIEECYQLNNDQEVNKPQYIGVCQAGTPIGVLQIRVNFPEEYSLEKCFEKFEEEAEKELEKMAKEFNEPPLFVPKTDGGIILP